jgi:hypothetical protein
MILVLLFKEHTVVLVEHLTDFSKLARDSYHHPSWADPRGNYRSQIRLDNTTLVDLSAVTVVQDLGSWISRMRNCNASLWATMRWLPRKLAVHL